SNVTLRARERQANSTSEHGRLRRARFLFTSIVARACPNLPHAWGNGKLPSLAGMRLGGSLALACCKVAVDACFLSSRIYYAGSGTGSPDPPVLPDRRS